LNPLTRPRAPDESGKLAMNVRKNCLSGILQKMKLLLSIAILGDRGSTVLKVLRYKLEGHWFDPRWCNGVFHWHKSFWSHYGPGVETAFNRNEYQEYFLGVNAAGA
jgi:hypothetical protein